MYRESCRSHRSLPPFAPIESLEPRRLLSAGDLDPTFSGDGKLTDSIGSDDANRNVAVVVQSDGKTVVAAADNSTLTVARYRIDGTPDAGFGQGGKVSVGITSLVEDLLPITEVAVDASGRIVI